MRALRFRVHTEWDVADARAGGHALAQALGFSPADAALVATAISELGHNAVTHAGGGELTVSEVRELGRIGLEVVASDRGPGIPDPKRALEGGFSTGGGLGLGLSGAQRMTDSFELHTGVGQGTRVVVRKYLDQALQGTAGRAPA